jgi:hypothetical protein
VLLKKLPANQETNMYQYRMDKEYQILLEVYLELVHPLKTLVSAMNDPAFLDQFDQFLIKQSNLLKLEEGRKKYDN